MEAGAGIEPANSGFADRDLTTWLPRRCARANNIVVAALVSTRESFRSQASTVDHRGSSQRKSLQLLRLNVERFFLNSRSSELFARAQERIPGGVNSPVRAFRNVGGEPFFVARGEGARIWDVDGNEYIDYIGSWGPAILGHAPKIVVDAVREAVTRGLSFGVSNPLEVEMAELICDWIPSIEKVRMVNSGTEATMSCIRLARAFTRRGKIIKFDGCYHGHSDSLLVQAGSGALTHGRPDAPAYRRHL